MTLKQKVATKAVQYAQKIAVRKAYKNTTKLAEKHRNLIKVIQDYTADIVEREDESKQGLIISAVCSNLIVGFDTQEEMNVVVEMIQKSIDQYWKQPIEQIPQLQPREVK